MIKIIKQFSLLRFANRIRWNSFTNKIFHYTGICIPSNRSFIFDSEIRVFCIKVIVVIGLIAELILTQRLWSGDRTFPHSPVLSFIPTLPLIFEAILYFSFIGLLLAILVFKKTKKLIYLSLVIAIIFTVFDQMRWQPWFYQNVFMLATLVLFKLNESRIGRRHVLLNSNRLIVASIYFYSGMQKINPGFINDIYPNVIEPALYYFPDSLKKYPIHLGMLVPILEMGIGLGLLMNKFRMLSVFFAVILHCFILFTLGPFGYNMNNVVWPWNIAMALFVIILFVKTEEVPFREIGLSKKYLFQKVIVLLFLGMPVLSFFNLWDSYLSSALYSGNTNEARIYIHDSVKNKLPAKIQHYVIKTNSTWNELDFYSWSIDELNVLPYPETRVYKDIARYVCMFSQNKNTVLLVVEGKPTIYFKDAKSICDCSNLK